ncbi:hypothetical protein BC829DRAFT_444013 [Chytridium lagenaria]|nr:hypothetical protein BC829DRAFT_444013 [Chytridium lagenaria]
MLENHIRDDHASSGALITLLLKLDSEATIERVLTMVIGGGSHAQAQPPLAQQTQRQPSTIGESRSAKGTYHIETRMAEKNTEEKKAIDRMTAEQKTLSGAIRMIPHLIEDAAVAEALRTKITEAKEKYLAAYRAGYTQQNPNVASYQVTDNNQVRIVWKTGKEFEEGEEQRRPSSPKLRVGSSKAIYVEDDSDNDEVHAQYKPALGQYIEEPKIASKGHPLALRVDVSKIRKKQEEEEAESRPRTPSEEYEDRPVRKGKAPAATLQQRRKEEIEGGPPSEEYEEEPPVGKGKAPKVVLPRTKRKGQKLLKKSSVEFMRKRQQLVG